MEEAYALYTESGDMYSNDIWTVVLCNGGRILHCQTSQLFVEKNSTFGISKSEPIEPINQDTSNQPYRV
jgi:hypothetical protein